MNATKVVRWLVLCGFGLAPSGCAPTQTGPEVNDTAPEVAKTVRALRLGMMPKLLGIGYFDACRKGAEEAARELGVELTFDGPTDDEVELQVRMIDEWIQRRYDIIAVSRTTRRRSPPP